MNRLVIALMIVCVAAAMVWDNAAVVVRKWRAR